MLFMLALAFLFITACKQLVHVHVIKLPKKKIVSVFLMNNIYYFVKMVETKRIYDFLF